MATFTSRASCVEVNHVCRNICAFIQGLLLVCLMALNPVLVAAESNQPNSTFWQGSLNYRGAAMNLKLRIQADEVNNATDPKAWLDLPDLLMDREPVPVSQNGAWLLIEFPFGIGEFAIDPMDPQIEASRQHGETAITLQLVPAPGPEFTIQPVEFESAGTRLVGEIAMPPGPGPHPAIVLMHGSSANDRQSWSYRSWADFLVRKGLAVLYYDKRGSGESGGDAGPGLRQLVKDGIAAVQTLRATKGIDPTRVGLKGSSQGAWVAEQMAADLGDISFLMLTGAPAVTPRQQELQQLEYGMRDDGLAESDIESALNYQGLYFYVARTGQGWPLLEQAIKQAQPTNWGQYVDQPRSLDDLAWWKQNHDFQTRPVISKLDLPVLLLYGAADWVVPPAENAEKLKSLFHSPQDVELHVFPFADHRLELPMGEDHTGEWQWPRIAPELDGVISRWLEKTLH